MYNRFIEKSTSIIKISTIILVLILLQPLIACQSSSIIEKPEIEESPEETADFNTSIVGKILCGYQGWFNTPADGANLDWKHYKIAGKFEPGTCSIDYWPDMSEYSADESYDTSFEFSNGATATVFSSANPKTVNRHFKWMKDYNIDGVFVQRFVANVGNKDLNNNLNKVFDNCINGARTNDRIISVMYDFSGSNSSNIVSKTKTDWKYLVDTYKLNNAKDDNLLTYKEKTVIALWGVGFKDRLYTLDNVKDLIEFFKNDPVYGGCSVLLGVPTGWRALTRDAVSDPKLLEVIKSADIVHPWTPGRYRNLTAVDAHKIDFTLLDKAWCDENDLMYMPVVFPGFSWQNLKKGLGEYAALGDIPRLKGDFLWRQFYNALSSDVETIYVAMFDELDEGTCIFKVADNTPIGDSKFLNYEGLPSDYYLWLTGQASSMLKKEIPLTEIKPVN